MNLQYFKITLLIPFIILLSFFSNWITGIVLPLLNSLISIKYLQFPSNIGIIISLLSIYNKWGWKLPVFKYLVKIPNLNGRYKGQLFSNYKKNKKQKEIIKDCVIEICQTASKIKIFTYFDNKKEHDKTFSKSIIELINKDDDNLFKICFNYRNSGNRAKNGLGAHDGYNELKYNPNTKELYGFYYTSPDRGTQGTIKVKFEGIKLKGRY